MFFVIVRLILVLSFVTKSFAQTDAELENNLYGGSWALDREKKTVFGFPLDAVIVAMLPLTNGGSYNVHSHIDAEIMRCSFDHIQESYPNLHEHISNLEMNLFDTKGKKDSILYIFSEINTRSKYLYSIGPASSEEVELTNIVDYPLVAPFASAISLKKKSSSNSSSTMLMNPSDSEALNAFFGLAQRSRWTIFSSIFVGDGLAAKDSWSSILNTSQSLSIVCACGSCSTGETKPDFQAKDIPSFSKCIQERGIKVVYFYAEPETPNLSTLVTKLQSSLPRDVTFFLSEKLVANPNQGLELGFIAMRYFGARLKANFKKNGADNYLKNCLASVRPKNHFNPNFQRFWDSHFKCSEKAATTCRGKISERKEPCKCTGDERLSRNLGSRDALIYDSVLSIIAAANDMYKICNAGEVLCNGGMFFRGNASTSLRNIKIQGLIGEISFSEIGDRRLKGLEYEYIMSIPGSKSEKTIGTFSVDTQRITKFETNVLLPASSLTPEATFYMAPGIIVNILSSILILTCFYLILYVKSHQNHPAIDIVFLVAIISGIIICCLSIIVFSFPTNDLTCQSRMWLLILGAVLIQSCLLAKVFKAFKAKSNGPSSHIDDRVGIWEIVIRYVTPLFLINAVLLVVWILKDGALRGNSSNLDKDPSSYFYTCTGLESDLGVSLFSSLVAFNIIVVSVIAILAAITGNLNSEFKYLKLSSYNILFLMVASQPLFFVVKANNEYVLRYLILSLTGVSILFFLIGVLMVPKIQSIRKGNESNVLSARDSVETRDPLEYLNIGSIGRKEE